MFALDIKSKLKQESLWGKTFTWCTIFAERQGPNIQGYGGHRIYFTASKGPESFRGSGKWLVRILK